MVLIITEYRVIYRSAKQSEESENLLYRKTTKKYGRDVILVGCTTSPSIQWSVLEAQKGSRLPGEVEDSSTHQTVNKPIRAKTILDSTTDKHLYSSEVGEKLN